jgi:Holliday junction DNA helicase RuvA
MIDYIRGELTELNPTYAIVETGGVGYCIHIALPVFSAISDKKQVKLFIHEAIREDAHVLYGFITIAERQLFLALISVSGIGANTARMIMSSYSAAEIQQMIATANVAALSSIKGIGAKTAQRIIVDLKDKILKINPSENNINTIFPVSSPIRDEAISALVMLGFAAAVSQKAVDNILKSSPDMPVEQLIKTALKNI